METDKRKKYKKLFLLFFTAMLLLHILSRVLSVGEKVEERQGVVFLRVSDLLKNKKEKERELKKLLLTLEKEKLSAGLPEGTTEQEALAGELAQGEKSVPL